MKMFLKLSVPAAAVLAVAALPYLPRISAQSTAPAAPQAGAGAQGTRSQAAPGAAAQARPAGAPRVPSTVGSQGPLPEHAKFESDQVEAGSTLFIQNCAFCHGKDAGGGETGPDLTRSKVVSGDKKGEAIGQVVRNGRPEKGMPAFSLADADILSLAAFVHTQQDTAMSQTGTRKGVEERDLHTGNAEAGRRYFDANCASCHSPVGDLSGVATRYTGLQLFMQTMYPRDAKPKVAVKTAAGQSYSGTLEYQDEFTIGMRDGSGIYRSWPASAITFKIDDPAEKHVTIMSNYTEKDLHDVLAYIQTLK